MNLTKPSALQAKHRNFRQWGHEIVQSYPARLAILIFLGLTFVITSLLMLPIMTSTGEPTPFVDALFTAVSAISVTGLATVDMGTHWSTVGDFVVVLGFQIGGIGVLTLASILGLTVTKRLGLRQKLLAASDNNIYGSNPSNITADRLTVGLGEIGSLLKAVAISLVVIEASLTLLIFPKILAGGTPPLIALGHSFYLAASAFTNTGFVPFDDGLDLFTSDYYLLSVLAIGVFLGSIGFPVIFALYRYLTRGGWKAHRRLGLHAKLTLTTTLILFSFGWIAISSLEWLNPKTLGELGPLQTVFSAGYTSVMTRSGGLGIVDPDLMNGSTLLVMDILMFIGGGSASTAGGIKVTTLAVLFLAAYSEARGFEEIQSFGRRIPVESLRLAVSIFIWGGLIVATASVTILHITDYSLDIVLFEVISAFGTCGLSTGLSAELPDAGKIVLALTMWAGRVGTVTLAAAIAMTNTKRLYRFPEERPIVG